MTPKRLPAGLNAIPAKIGTPPLTSITPSVGLISPSTIPAVSKSKIPNIAFVLGFTARPRAPFTVSPPNTGSLATVMSIVFIESPLLGFISSRRSSEVPTA